MSFPVASALVHHQVGPAELSGQALSNPEVLALARRVELIEESRYNGPFPVDRISRVVIETRNGQIFDSGDVRSPWNTLNPPSDDELHQKFQMLAGTTLPADRAMTLAERLWTCDRITDASNVLALLAPASQ